MPHRRTVAEPTGAAKTPSSPSPQAAEHKKASRPQPRAPNGYREWGDGSSNQQANPVVPTVTGSGITPVTAENGSTRGSAEKHVGDGSSPSAKRRNAPSQPAATTADNVNAKVAAFAASDSNSPIDPGGADEDLSCSSPPNAKPKPSGAITNSSCVDDPKANTPNPNTSPLRSPTFVDEPLQASTFARRPSYPSESVHNPLIDDLLEDMNSGTVAEAVPPLGFVRPLQGTLSRGGGGGDDGDDDPKNNSRNLLDNYYLTQGAGGGNARVWPGNSTHSGTYTKCKPPGASTGTPTALSAGNVLGLTAFPLAAGNWSGSSASAVGFGGPNGAIMSSETTADNAGYTTATVQLAVTTLKQASQCFVHTLKMHDLDCFFEPCGRGDADTRGDQCENASNANNHLREQRVKDTLTKKSQQETNALVLDLLDILEEVRVSRGKITLAADGARGNSAMSLFPDLDQRRFGSGGDTDVLGMSMMSTMSTASLARPPVHETHKIKLKYDPLERKKLINNYLILANLGKGSYGKVKLGEDLTTKGKVAIKIIDKKHLQKKFGGISAPPGPADSEDEKSSSARADDTTAKGAGKADGPAAQRAAATATEDNALKREIAIMKQIRHRNCVSLYEVIDDPSSQKLYLIMDYIPNGPVVKLKQNKIPFELIKNIEGNTKVNNVVYNRYLIRCCVRQQLIAVAAVARPNGNKDHARREKTKEEEEKVVELDGESPLTQREISGGGGGKSEVDGCSPNTPTLPIRSFSLTGGGHDEHSFFLFTCKPVKEEIVFIYLRQLVSGLRYLHKKNVVHHDIKPDNILLGINNHVYLTDFGVSEIFEKKETAGGKGKAGSSASVGQAADSTNAEAKQDDAADAGQDDNSTTNECGGRKAPRFGAGTLLFTAPELFSDDPDALYRVNPFLTDVWALGVTIYCVLMGVSPFNGKNYQEISYNIKHVQFPFNGRNIENSTVQPEWEVIFRGLLHKCPKKRWSLSHLRNFLDTEPSMKALYANGAAYAMPTTANNDSGDFLDGFASSIATPPPSAHGESGFIPATATISTDTMAPNDPNRRNGMQASSKPSGTATVDSSGSIDEGGRGQSNYSNGGLTDTAATRTGSTTAVGKHRQSSFVSTDTPGMRGGGRRASLEDDVQQPPPKRRETSAGAELGRDPQALTSPDDRTLSSSSLPTSPLLQHHNSGHVYAQTAAERVGYLPAEDIENATRKQVVEVVTVYQKKHVLSEAARSVVHDYVANIRFRISRRRKNSTMLVPTEHLERQRQLQEQCMMNASLEVSDGNDSGDTDGGYMYSTSVTHRMGVAVMGNSSDGHGSTSGCSAPLISTVSFPSALRRIETGGKDVFYVAASVNRERSSLPYAAGSRRFSNAAGGDSTTKHSFTNANNTVSELSIPTLTSGNTRSISLAHPGCPQHASTSSVIVPATSCTGTTIASTSPITTSGCSSGAAVNDGGARAVNEMREMDVNALDAILSIVNLDSTTEHSDSFSLSSSLNTRRATNTTDGDENERSHSKSRVSTMLSPPAADFTSTMAAACHGCGADGNCDRNTSLSSANYHPHHHHNDFDSPLNLAIASGAGISAATMLRAEHQHYRGNSSSSSSKLARQHALRSTEKDESTATYHTRSSPPRRAKSASSKSSGDTDKGTRGKGSTALPRRLSFSSSTVDGAEGRGGEDVARSGARSSTTGRERGRVSLSSRKCSLSGSCSRGDVDTEAQPASTRSGKLTKLQASKRGSAKGLKSLLSTVASRGRKALTPKAPVLRDAVQRGEQQQQQQQHAQDAQTSLSARDHAPVTFLQAIEEVSDHGAVYIRTMPYVQMKQSSEAPSAANAGRRHLMLSRGRQGRRSCGGDSENASSSSDSSSGDLCHQNNGDSYGAMAPSDLLNTVAAAASPVASPPLQQLSKPAGSHPTSGSGDQLNNNGDGKAFTGKRPPGLVSFAGAARAESMPSTQKPGSSNGQSRVTGTSTLAARPTPSDRQAAAVAAMTSRSNGKHELAGIHGHGVTSDGDDEECQRVLSESVGHPPNRFHSISSSHGTKSTVEASANVGGQKNASDSSNANMKNNSIRGSLLPPSRPPSRAPEGTAAWPEERGSVPTPTPQPVPHSMTKIGGRGTDVSCHGKETGTVTDSAQDVVVGKGQRADSSDRKPTPPPPTLHAWEQLCKGKHYSSIHAWKK